MAVLNLAVILLSYKPR